MKKKKQNLILAISLFVGTIVGVGIFGLPYVAAKTGVPIAIAYVLFIGLVTIVVNLAYAEIICNSNGEHRLVGYSEKYLGKFFKTVASFSLLFGFFGSLLAYLIIAGEFLHILFNSALPFSAFEYSIFFFFAGAFLIYLGINSIAETEVFMTIFLIAIVVILFIASFTKINTANLVTADFSKVFLPYGVVLFSLGGLSVVPEVTSLVKKDGESLSKAIKWGSIIPICLYIIFIISIVGITGAATSQESISGLIGHLHPQIVLLGTLFGFLAVATSFLALGFNLKNAFIYDYYFPHGVAWFLVVIVPLLLFLAGIGQFITIINLIGVFAGGIDGILVIMIYNKVKRQKKRVHFFEISLLVQIGIVILFTLGIAYQFIY